MYAWGVVVNRKHTELGLCSQQAVNLASEAGKSHWIKEALRTASRAQEQSGAVGMGFKVSVKGPWELTSP